MSSPVNALHDTLGPRGKARNLLISTVSALAILALLGWVVYTAAGNDIFNDRWAVLVDPSVLGKNQSAGDVWYSLVVRGLIFGTLKAVAISVPIVAVFSLVVMVARLAPQKWFSWPARAFIEVFRGLPVLLVMLFTVLALDTDPIIAVVVGLVMYNSAVVAEILRAGVASLPKGQYEAGLSIGLTRFRTLMLIQLPQAIRIMLPALVSQIVVLLKDTSLGFIIAYAELLNITKNNYNYFGEETKVVFVAVAAVLYIGTNALVSTIARFIDERSRSRKLAQYADPDAPIDTGRVNREGMAIAAQAHTGHVDPDNRDDT